VLPGVADPSQGEELFEVEVGEDEGLEFGEVEKDLEFGGGHGEVLGCGLDIGELCLCDSR